MWGLIMHSWQRNDTPSDKPTRRSNMTRFFSLILASRAALFEREWMAS
jgi:hypothetical protein